MAAERLARVLEVLPLATLLFDDGGLVYANAPARALFPAAVTGAAPHVVLAGTPLADAVAEASHTGQPVQIELRHGQRDLSVQALVTAETEVALVVSDVSETRRVEAVRRDFVTNASHELKTPVAGMQALADSLSLAIDRDPDRARTMIDRLGEEALRLGALMRELLDLARLEEASAKREQRVDVAAMVGVQAERLSALAVERGVEITVDNPDPAIVVAAPEDIRLVIVNLLTNAVGYNRPGGTVHAATRRTRGQVVLTVADTGIGIAEEDQSRVFERFYRVDRARSRAAGGGTGLGLSIVRHAVARHGGTISVSSVLGEGTTFEVRLPVVADSVLGEQRRGEPASIE